jgi:hypothetical protein
LSGGTDFSRRLAYQQGLEVGGLDDPHGDSIECLDNDTRYGGTALLGWYTNADFKFTACANYYDIDGARVAIDDEIFDNSDELLADSVFVMIQQGGLFSTNSETREDQQVVMSYLSDVTLHNNDTITIWSVMASVPGNGTSNTGDPAAGLAELKESIDLAKLWYLGLRGCLDQGCCRGTRRGDVDYLTDAGEPKVEGQEVDLGDMGLLVSFLFSPPGSVTLLCTEESDVSPSPLADPDKRVDLSDMGELVTFLFSPPGSVVLEPCPQ